MAQKFVTPITIKNLASSGSDALTVFLNGEAYGRVKLEAGGRISWSDGTGTYDTNIYRDSANVLATDDVLKATAGVITMAVAGVPSAALANGALAVDTTNNAFYFRSNDAWNQVTSGGGASVTVSDSAPASPDSGDLWFDSTSLEMFIYYGSAWVQLNADTGAEELSDLFDVEFTNLTANQILKYDGESWVNGNGSSTTVSDTAPATPESGDLWYDSTSLTLFIYYSNNWVELTPDIQVEELSDLFDIEFTNLTQNQILKYDGEKWVNGNGSSTTVSDSAPASAESGDLWYDSTTLGLFIYYSGNWIELNPDTGAEELSDLVDINITNPTDGQVLKYNGTEWVNDSDAAGTTISSIDDINDVTIASLANGQILQWNGSAWVNAAIAAGATVNVSETAPASPSSGDLWFESDTAKTFIYYDSQWIEVGAQAPNGASALTTKGDLLSRDSNTFARLAVGTNGYFLKADSSTATGLTWSAVSTINNLDGIDDVTITSAANGQFLKWNGTAWVNDAIDLGTDTTGNYVSGVSSGTGISVSHTPSEGSTATVSLDATLDNLSNVTVPSPTANDVLQWNGTAWVNVAASTVGATTLDGLSDVVISSAEEFQTLEYNGTNWVNAYASTVTYVRNAEATTITTGTVVYLFGATGDHATVKRADKASDATSSKTVGVIGANIAASQNGPVVTRGYVDGINLSVGYSPGDVLWLGSNGQFTTTKAVAPDHLVFVGVVVRATNNGIIYVATQNGYELDELHNVNATSPNSGDFLKYNGSLWVNDAIDLGTDTTGSYVQSLVAGTGVTLTNNSGESATPTIAIGQDVATNSNVTFNNLTVAGNLTVSGTTTSISTETVTIDDNIIVLNNNATGAPSVDAGIEIERGSSTNVLIRWNETTDKWQFTNDGSTYSDLGAGGASVSSSAPASPTSGALWFNQDTAQTFVYYGSVWIEVGAVSNGARVEVSASAPASPVTGDLWFDSDTAQTFAYYDSQWVEIGASGMAASIGDTAPTSPVSGQIWFDSTNASTNVYYDSHWVEVGGTTEVFNFIDAKGDLIVGTADNTVDNLAVGTNGQVLTADSTTATGLKWSTPTVYQEVVANVSNTEIGYLDGVTSAIQTQIDTKASTGKAIAMSLIFGG